MATSDSRDDRPGTVSLADEEAVKQVLVGAVLGLWDVVIGRRSISRPRRWRSVHEPVDFATASLEVRP
jgi:hypothetical protein